MISYHFYFALLQGSLTSNKQHTSFRLSVKVGGDAFLWKLKIKELIENCISKQVEKNKISSDLSNEMLNRILRNLTNKRFLWRRTKLLTIQNAQ